MLRFVSMIEANVWNFACAAQPFWPAFEELGPIFNIHVLGGNGYFTTEPEHIKVSSPLLRLEVTFEIGASRVSKSWQRSSIILRKVCVAWNYNDHPPFIFPQLRRDIYRDGFICPWNGRLQF